MPSLEVDTNGPTDLQGNSARWLKLRTSYVCPPDLTDDGLLTLVDLG